MRSVNRSLGPILLVNFIGTLGFSIVIPFLVFLVTDMGGNGLRPCCSPPATEPCGRRSRRCSPRRPTRSCRGRPRGFAGAAGSLASILGLLAGGVLFEWIGGATFAVAAAVLLLVAGLGFRWCDVAGPRSRAGARAQPDFAGYPARDPGPADGDLRMQAPDSSPSPVNDALSLYHFETCPYCVRVRRVIDRLGLDVELRNIHHDDAHWDALLEARGVPTVPVLRIDSADGGTRWLPESADIVRYLEENYG